MKGPSFLHVLHFDSKVLIIANSLVLTSWSVCCEGLSRCAISDSFAAKGSLSRFRDLNPLRD